MISKDEAIAKFQEIIGTKDGWQFLKDSQFVQMLSTFQSWALRDAQYSAERAQQEFFLSTALNYSSIAAHAEDRGYLPRPPKPSSGTATITNKGAETLIVPASQPFQSNKGIPYLTQAIVTIQPGDAATVSIIQAEKTEVLASISESVPFFEILFDPALTSKIYAVDVYADIQDGAGETKWSLARMFSNSDETSLVYDLFYSHAGQIGVRFGNGIFGHQPPAGSAIRCVLWATLGDTSLLFGQALHIIGTLLDIVGAAAAVTIETTNIISGGSSAEGTEELRRNLIYWPVYHDEFVWREDYVFFLKRRLPGILWLKVWGEAEAEIEAGEFDQSFINTIFVSAYSPSMASASLWAQISEAFSSVKIFNRKFRWIEPSFRTFNLSVTGKISREFSSVTAIAAIEAALLTAYGKDSPARKDTYFLKDVYKIVNDTGFFSSAGASFEVSMSGPAGTTLLNEMLCLGLTTITLEYL